jgi:hypothetical protein
MQYKKSGAPLVVEDSVEVDRLKLHAQSLHAFSFLLIADELFDIAIDFVVLILIFVIGLVGGVSFPSHLFLFSESCLLILVLAIETYAELSALDALIEALAVLLPAVGLFACAEVEVLDCGLFGVGVLVVVHVPVVLLLQRV